MRGIGADEADDGGHSSRTALRRAVVTALVGFSALFVLEARQIDAGAFAWLATRYGVEAALCILILVVAYSARGARYADWLGFLLAASCSVNLSLSLFVWRPDPGLPAGALASQLVGTVVLFGWGVPRMLALSAVACLSFAAVAVLGVGDGGDALAAAAVVLGGGVVNAIVGAYLMASMRSRLVRRQRELAALSVCLMATQEEERRRLSRELHDEIGQSLTAALAYLWCVDRDSPAEQDGTRTPVGEARQLLVQTLGVMRDLSQLLRPPTLDEFGLLPSLESYLKAFGTRHHITTRLATDGVPARLPPALETALYRIVQEALTNVARHAKARHVRVGLAAEDGQLRLEVEDDGIGMGAAPANGGIGLVGIRERVRALGGAVSISAGPGFRLGVRVPLPDAI